MSLQIVAQHLASKGRGPDTTLVHMTPGEVSGLHALAKAHGAALTTNPDTGLPEAGILSKLLPTLIGAGITAATGGAAAGVMPWMVGAGVGGLEALRTGNLGQGLMAGLGAYGGAGLTGSLAGMGTGALSQQAGAAASQGLEGVAADQAAEQAIKERLANASFMDKLKAGAGTFEWNKPKAFLQGLGDGSTGKGIGMLGAAFGPGVMAALEPNQYAPQQMVGDSTRAPGLVYRGGNVYDRMTSEQEAERKSKYGYAEGGLATGGVPEWNKAWNPDVPEYGDLGRDFGREILYYNPASALPPLAKLAQEQAAVSEGPGGYDGRGGDGGSEAGAPGGGYGIPGATNINGVSGPTTGLASLANQAAATLGNWGLTGLSDAIAKNVDPNYSHEGRSGTGASDSAAKTDAAAALADAMSNAISGAADTGPSGGGDFGGGYDGGDPGGSGPRANGGMVGQYAQGGGIGSLGSYSDGGRLLRGPGDGVSDHIPATIGAGKQPARLADGEFVVPARIVSELGNGSTEAGARALYAMMDRIQKNRRKTVGKGKVAVNSKSTRLLPA